MTGTSTRSCHCSRLSMSGPNGGPAGRKPRNPQQTSVVVTKAGSKSTTGRRRTRAAARRSWPASRSGGEQPVGHIEPELAVIGVYVTDATSAAPDGSPGLRRAP